MKTIFLSTLAALALLLAGCSDGESYSRPGYDFAAVEKVAVIEVTGTIGSEAAKNQISDYFVMELLKKGYSPVERRQIQALVAEQDMQASDITTAEGAARAGRILNMPVVFIINIPSFAEDIEMTAKMIDVEDGSILWMGTGTGSTGKTLGTIAGAAAGAVVGSQLSDDHRTGAAIGGAVLGGVAGNALAPQTAKLVKDIIAKMCQSMPSRL